MRKILICTQQDKDTQRMGLPFYADSYEQIHLSLQQKPIPHWNQILHFANLLIEDDHKTMHYENLETPVILDPLRAEKRED